MIDNNQRQFWNPYLWCLCINIGLLKKEGIYSGKMLYMNGGDIELQGWYWNLCRSEESTRWFTSAIAKGGIKGSEPWV